MQLYNPYELKPIITLMLDGFFLYYLHIISLLSLRWQFFSLLIFISLLSILALLKNNLFKKSIKIKMEVILKSIKIQKKLPSLEKKSAFITCIF